MRSFFFALFSSREEKSTTHSSSREESTECTLSLSFFPFFRRLNCFRSENNNETGKNTTLCFLFGGLSSFFFSLSLSFLFPESSSSPSSIVKRKMAGGGASRRGGGGGGGGGGVATAASARRGDEPDGAGGDKNLALVLDAISSHNNNQGINDEELAKALPDSLTMNMRLEIINKLLEKEQIMLHTGGENGICYFTRNSEEEMRKKQGLTSEDRLVLQIIETAGNNGMWTKEVKQKSNLPQAKVTKIFKTLEGRQLIKSVKHVAQQNRKVYMKFDLEPSREITGGAWFTDQEFDGEFVEVMRTQCLNFIRYKKRVTLQDVYDYIVESKVSNVNLRKEDVKQIVDTLIYDGDVDMITPEDRRKQKMDEYEDDFIDDSKKNRRGNAEGMLMYESDEEEDDEEDEEDSEEEEDEDNATRKRKKGSANKKKNSKKQKKTTAESKKGSASATNNKKQHQKRKGGGGNESEETTIEIDEDEDDFTETYYVPSKWKSNIVTPLSYVPCGICTLVEDCTPGGLISPEKCVYMSDWIRDIEETGNTTVEDDDEEEE